MLGARWIRSGDGTGAAGESIAYGSDAAGGQQQAGVGFEASGEDVVVHVAGAVERPGVYRLPTGSRVADAIERAGGATATGLPDAINLAARVADGQQIQLPDRRQAPVGVAGGTARGGETTGPSAWVARRPSSSTRSRASGRSRPRRSFSSATSAAASHRSTSSTRSAASGRRRWRPCGRACSREPEVERRREVCGARRVRDRPRAGGSRRGPPAVAADRRVGRTACAVAPGRRRVGSVAGAGGGGGAVRRTCGGGGPA